MPSSSPSRSPLAPLLRLPPSPYPYQRPLRLPSSTRRPPNMGRTLIARRFTHEQAVSAIVVSYYWHFVDVVWIALFATIYLIK